jgi:nitrite reductase/ring-hydroxylating ferredoxin subunit
MSPKLCRVADLPDDNGLERQVPGPQGNRRLVLFRTPIGIRAYLNVCPHQGRSLDFAPGEFLLGERGELICPHHGACFELAEGTCLSGPCQGDHLTAVPVRVEDGMVYLDETP